MNITKPLALIIGMVTLLPGVYMALFFATFLAGFGSERSPDRMPVFGSFETMMALHLGTMLLSVLLLVFYIVHAFKNPQLQQDKRILWVIVLFFGNVIAGIVYWWIYVWRARPLEANSGGTAS